jgi:hypothetical protein
VLFSSFYVPEKVYHIVTSLSGMFRLIRHAAQAHTTQLRKQNARKEYIAGVVTNTGPERLQATRRLLNFDNG